MVGSLSELVKMAAPKKVPNIFIAVPSCRDWKTEFGSSLMVLSSHLTSMFHEGKIDGINIRCKSSALLPAGRQALLEEALASDATHILWIDDDTKFPPEAVDCLLSRNLDYVAANICRKTVDLSPTAMDAAGLQIDSTGREGVQEAHWVGLGMCLIRLDAIRNILAPHFEVLWLKNKNKYLGEDMYFCEKLRQGGVKMYIDHDVSNMVAHIGDYFYQYPKMERKREAA